MAKNEPMLYPQTALVQCEVILRSNGTSLFATTVEYPTQVYCNQEDWVEPWPSKDPWHGRSKNDSWRGSTVASSHRRLHLDDDAWGPAEPDAGSFGAALPQAPQVSFSYALSSSTALSSATALSSSTGDSGSAVSACLCGTPQRKSAASWAAFDPKNGGVRDRPLA